MYVNTVILASVYSKARNEHGTGLQDPWIFWNLNPMRLKISWFVSRDLKFQGIQFTRNAWGTILKSEYKWYQCLYVDFEHELVLSNKIFLGRSRYDRIRDLLARSIWNGPCGRAPRRGPLHSFLMRPHIPHRRSPTGIYCQNRYIFCYKC